MMRAMGSLVLACAALSAADGTAQAPYHPSPLGAAVVLRLSQEDADPIRGELIAATTDTVWVLDSAVLYRVPLGSIQQVEFRRFESGASTAWIWGIAAGLVSAGALTAACSSVEGNDGCGSVFPAVMVRWMLWAGLGAATLSASSGETLPPNVDALQPYARFPQGLPPGVDRTTLRVGVSLPLPRS